MLMVILDTHVNAHVRTHAHTHTHTHTHKVFMVKNSLEEFEMKYT